MIHFTKEQIEFIVNSYKNGSTLREIAENFCCSRPTIQKVVKSNYSGYLGKKRIKMASDNQTKKCSKCGRELPLEAFSRGNSLYGRRSFCKECEHAIQNSPEYRKRKREMEKQRRLNPEYVLHRNAMDKKRRMKDPKHWLWVSAKNRAKNKGWEFTITEEDFDLPSTCPLLGIPMWKNSEEACSNSYSLDRIDSSKGYIPGNVWVISKRANAIKNNATLEELELLTKNLRNHWVH